MPQTNLESYQGLQMLDIGGYFTYSIGAQVQGFEWFTVPPVGHVRTSKVNHIGVFKHQIINLPNIFGHYKIGEFMK